MKYTIYQWNGEEWAVLYKDVELSDLPESIQRAEYLLRAIDKKPSAAGGAMREIAGYCDRYEYSDSVDVLLFFEEGVVL